MLRRYLSTSVKRISCGNCVFYNKINGVCKFNKLPALDNRLNSGVCGKEATQFWELDRTSKYKGDISCLLAIGSLFTFMWAFERSGLIFTMAGTSAFISCIMADVYYNRYNSDNHIFEEKKQNN